MENNLESYLAAIESQLNDVPAVRKTEFIDEARAHLYAMVEAKRADDLDAATAWLQAMAEFGEPGKVGRDLRAQWASSGQLETEGVPLSPRRKMELCVLAIVSPIVCGGVAYAITMRLLMSTQPSLIVMKWINLGLILVPFGLFIYAIAFSVRKRGGWKASTVVAAVNASLFFANALLSIHVTPQNAEINLLRSEIIFAIVMLFTLLYLWLYKRERADRPWQFSTVYKTNPIAAEQRYKLGPIYLLAVVCIGMSALAFQFFGLPLALLSCAGVIGSSVILGKWLLN